MNDDDNATEGGVTYRISARARSTDWKLLPFDVVVPASAKRNLVCLSAHDPGRVDIDNVSVVTL